MPEESLQAVFPQLFRVINSDESSPEFVDFFFETSCSTYSRLNQPPRLEIFTRGSEKSQQLARPRTILHLPKRLERWRMIDNIYRLHKNLCFPEQRLLSLPPQLCSLP
jgi:hypothetical protein